MGFSGASEGFSGAFWLSPVPDCFSLPGISGASAGFSPVGISGRSPVRSSGSAGASAGFSPVGFSGAASGFSGACWPCSILGVWPPMGSPIGPPCGPPSANAATAEVIIATVRIVTRIFFMGITSLIIWLCRYAGLALPACRVNLSKLTVLSAGNVHGSLPMVK